MKRMLIPFLLATACSGDPEVPADVLPVDRFTTVLLEAQLIEARVNHEMIIAHHASIPAEQFYSEMFKANGVTRESFARSFTYYSGRPELMKSIYEDIFAELGRRKDAQPE